MLTAKLKEVATILSDDYLNQPGATYSLSTGKDYHDVLTHSSALDPLTMSGISIPQTNFNRLQNISSESFTEIYDSLLVTTKKSKMLIKTC